MTKHRRDLRFLVVVPMFVAVACGGLVTDSDDTEPNQLQQAQSSADSRLPSNVDVEAVIRRKSEVAAFVLGNHERQGHVFVLSETLEDGTIVDWFDRASVVGDDEPMLTTMEIPAQPEGVEVARPMELSGPPGAVPYIRPSVPPYVQGKSGKNTIEDYVRSLQKGHPLAPKDRLYAQFVLTTTNYGGFGAINGLWDATDNPSSPEFVINELGSYCISGATQEQVGVVAGRLPGVYGNNYVLAAEYFGGTDAGGWVGVASAPAYVQFSGQITPGTVLTGVSTQGGTQYEAPVHIIFRDDTNPKRWELGYNGVAFGYVKVTTAGFSLINASACMIGHYSEAYDPNHTSQPWMDSDMGSSLFPTSTLIANNYGSRAFFRAARYYTSPKGVGLTNTSAAAQATDRFCYDSRRVTDGTPSSTWNPTLFFGGPGGDGPLCTQDPSCQTGLANGTACCAESCGTCGGSGCGSRPGGAANCCTSNINNSSKLCSSNRPPCRL